MQFMVKRKSIFSPSLQLTISSVDGAYTAKVRAETKENGDWISEVSVKGHDKDVTPEQLLTVARAIKETIANKTSVIPINTFYGHLVPCKIISDSLLGNVEIAESSRLEFYTASSDDVGFVSKFVANGSYLCIPRVLNGSMLAALYGLAHEKIGSTWGLSNDDIMALWLSGDIMDIRKAILKYLEKFVTQYEDTNEWIYL